MAIQEGKAAPEFTLTNPDGKRVSLKDFAGRDVILYFYPKDDTPGCTKEACGFRDHWKAFGTLRAVVLGVSADGSESHKKFAARVASLLAPAGKIDTVIDRALRDSRIAVAARSPTLPIGMYSPGCAR
jgi:alkyl hydroperoxide reductase subunit AhpC